MNMKAVQSFWVKQNSKEIDYFCGWKSIRFSLFSWALSSLQLTKFFDRTELVSDCICAELAAKLHLPYTSIKTDLETIKYKNHLWVSNKLYTYSIQNEAFIHLDTDAYLFNHIDKRLLTAPLVAQNFEYDHANYIQAYQDVMTYCTYIPDWICKDEAGRLTAVNAGLIGGNNVSFFQDFTAAVNYFLEQNQDGLRHCQCDYLNVFVEQFLFTKYAEFKNVPIEYISPIEFGPPCDYGMAEFTQLPAHCNYIHITNYKRNLMVCEQMAQRLWLEAPELYERVLTVCRELEATHHSVTQSVVIKQQSSMFYRTGYILGIINPSLHFGQSTPEWTELINQFSEEQPKNVLADAFQYERYRQKFVESLPDPIVFKQHWEHYSEQANALLSLPRDVFSHKVIRQSSYCYRIESEWNWAEVNEFAGQTADRDLAGNLQTEPAYYETLLYVYWHTGIIREQLLDALNILILDALEAPTSIASVMDTVGDQVLAYQSQVDRSQLADTILKRIQHFLYHGILEVV